MQGTIPDNLPQRPKNPLTRDWVGLSESLPEGNNLIGQIGIENVKNGLLLPIEAFAKRSVIHTLMSAVRLDDAPTSFNSLKVDCSDYRKFTLYLYIDSTLAPTTVQFIVQFSDDDGTTWYTYKQGLFASLFYEDTDTASGINECFSGDCAGRIFRLRAVAVGSDATNYFDVTAKVEFWN